MPATAKVVMSTASVQMPAATCSRRVCENGSSQCPARPAVMAKPAIIMIHTRVAAGPRRSGATDWASITSKLVPQALTPVPISKKPSRASARPDARSEPAHTVPSVAIMPPAASTTMPPMIQGVRRPPMSEPWPMRGREI